MLHRPGDAQWPVHVLRALREKRHASRRRSPGACRWRSRRLCRHRDPHPLPLAGAPPGVDQCQRCFRSPRQLLGPADAKLAHACQDMWILLRRRGWRPRLRRGRHIWRRLLQRPHLPLEHRRVGSTARTRSNPRSAPGHRRCVPVPSDRARPAAAASSSRRQAPRYGGVRHGSRRAR